MIEKATGKRRDRRYVDLVESIAYSSDNPAFRSPAFRKALADYRRYQCHTPNKAEFDLELEVETIKQRLGI